LFLVDARAQVPELRGRMGWKSTSFLGLEGVEVEEWNRCIRLLVSNFIMLHDDEEDSLCWSKNVKIGEYTTKLGYKVWMEDCRREKKMVVEILVEN
jgi:hypothetical protein